MQSCQDAIFRVCLLMTHPRAGFRKDAAHARVLQRCVPFLHMKGLHSAIMWLTGRVMKAAQSPSFSTGASKIDFSATVKINTRALFHRERQRRLVVMRSGFERVGNNGRRCCVLLRMFFAPRNAKQAKETSVKALTIRCGPQKSTRFKFVLDVAFRFVGRSGGCVFN
jgi:hypothetical protein